MSLKRKGENMKLKSYTIQSIGTGMSNQSSILQHPGMMVFFAIYVAVLVGLIVYSILSYFDIKRQYLGIARRKYPELIRPKKSQIPSRLKRWKICHHQNKFFKVTEEGSACSTAWMAAFISVLVCGGALMIAMLELAI